MRVVAAVTVALLVAAPAWAQGTPPGRFVSTDGGFSAAMPCAPTPTPAAPNAPPVPGRVSVECSLPGFYAGVTSMPLISLEAPDAELDYEINLVVENMKGRILSQTPIALGRFPGRDVQIAVAENVVVRCRWYLIEEKNRMIQVVTVVDPAVAVKDRIAALFDTFTVLDTPAADVRPAAITSRLATRMNRALPTTVDQITDLVSTIGLQGVMAYQYRITTFALAEIDATRFLAGMKATVTTANCASPTARDGMLRQGITIRHIYADRDLRQIGIVDVTAADCPLR